MSNWSSFENDKEFTDAWRQFLAENEDEEIEIDEGLWDRIKTAAKAGKDAFVGHGLQQQFKKGKTARAGMAATGKQVADMSKLATTGAVKAAQDAGSEVADDARVVDKIDLPLSVTKKQKGIKPGAGGQTEQPVVMQLQKMGMSQQSAQQIAKRIRDYLQQRKVPVAEGALNEDTIANQVRKSMLGKMQSLLKDKASDEAKERGMKMVMAAHSLAKSGQTDKFRDTVLKWAKKGQLGGWITTADGLEQFGQLSQDEIAALMQSLLKHPQFRKYHQAGYERRQAKAAGKAQKRGELRGVGADKGIIGKIISRFVSDNQEMLAKDPGLQAIFDDPVKFNNLRKAVTNGLKRQLKRRGWAPDQYAGILEEVFYQEIQRMLNEEK